MLEHTHPCSPSLPMIHGLLERRSAQTLGTICSDSVVECVYSRVSEGHTSIPLHLGSAGLRCSSPRHTHTHTQTHTHSLSRSLSLCVCVSVIPIISLSLTLSLSLSELLLSLSLNPSLFTPSLPLPAVMPNFILSHQNLERRLSLLFQCYSWCCSMADGYDMKTLVTWTMCVDVLMFSNNKH